MKKKVLVVDDDRGILDVVTIILQGEGYDVLPLQDAGVLEKKLTEYNPQLILLDYWLPGYDGQQILTKLKREEKTKKIPVVVISADHKSEADVISFGANGFLAKPFDITELVEKVDYYIAKNSKNN